MGHIAKNFENHFSTQFQLRQGKPLPTGTPKDTPTFARACPIAVVPILIIVISPSSQGALSRQCHPSSLGAIILNQERFKMAAPRRTGKRPLYMASKSNPLFTTMKWLKPRSHLHCSFLKIFKGSHVCCCSLN